jgi:probable O-glycosylation ligase (exosortase A-associated)
MSIRLSLFFVITIVVFFTTFRKPKVGLFYFLLLLFLRDGYLMENIPEIYTNWHLPLITAWVVLISWVFHTFLQGEKVNKPFEFILLLALGVIIFASKRNAYVPERTMRVFNEYIRMVVLVFLMINIIKTKKDLKQISLVLTLLMTFLVLYAYYRYKREGFSIAVPSVYYVDRNFFAESIVAILPLAFMFYEDSLTKIKKFFFLGIVAAMAGGVILTFSRGGLLALLIVLFFLFLQAKKKMQMVISGMFIFLLFLPHIGQKYRERMSTIKTYEEDTSAMTRVTTWEAGINMFEDHPVIGVGAGNFNSLFWYYKPEKLKKYGGNWVSIHNMFLQILSETGLSGGGLFLLVILGCFLSLYRLNRKNKMLPEEKQVNLAIPNALRVSLLGFCGAGFFLPGAYYSYIYIIFALIMASKNIYAQEIEGLVQ